MRLKMAMKDYYGFSKLTIRKTWVGGRGYTSDTTLCSCSMLTRESPQPAGRPSTQVLQHPHAGQRKYGAGQRRPALEGGWQRRDLQSVLHSLHLAAGSCGCALAVLLLSCILGRSTTVPAQQTCLHSTSTVSTVSRLNDLQELPAWPLPLASEWRHAKQRGCGGFIGRGCMLFVGVCGGGGTRPCSLVA